MFIVLLIAIILNIKECYAVTFSSYDMHGSLFIVDDDKAIIREKNGSNKFQYRKPQDGCYPLKNYLNVCIEENQVVAINGKFRPQGSDVFFTESSRECNKLKFSVINDFIIEKKPIYGIEYQIIVYGYFDVLRLFIFKDKSDPKSTTRAFIASSTNDFGCSKFDKYSLYEIDANNDKKNKDIISTNPDTVITNAATENAILDLSYRPMILDGYKLLIPTKENDKDDIMTVSNSIVKTLKLKDVFDDIVFHDL